METTRIEVKANGVSYTFAAIGKVVTFDGFMRAYVKKYAGRRRCIPIVRRN